MDKMTNQSVLGMIIFFLSISTNTFAYDVEIGGIYYNLNNSAKTAEVTYNKAFGNNYSGEVVIPETINVNGNNYSVTEIDWFTFDGSKDLKSVSIPKSVKTLSVQSFYDCPNLESIIIDKDNKFYDSRDNCNAIIRTSSDALIVGCKGTTIPSSIKTIGESAFRGSNISSIVIPSGIVSIGNNAFYNCRMLADVETKISSPFAIDTSVFDRISSDAKLVVPKGTKNSYSIYSGWTKNFKEIVEANEDVATKYILSITASGNGSASYNGTTVRGKTASFTVNEGTSAKITFTPDNGYRIKKVKVNNSSVSVSNNQYTITNIKANTIVSVEFEAISVTTTYTLSISASDNGSVSYDGTTIRVKIMSFTVNEGTSAIIKFTPDAGCRIKDVKVNGSTVSFSNSQYTISSISRNTTVEVEFEKVSIESGDSYNSYVTCVYRSSSITQNGSRVENYVGFEIMNSGNSSIYITKVVTKDPDTDEVLATSTDSSILGYLNGGETKKLSVKLNKDIVPNWELTYTLDNKEYIYDNTQYVLLYITANKYGELIFIGSTIGDETKRFSIIPGSNATVEISHGEECVLSKLTINGADETTNITDNKFLVTNITARTNVRAVFDKISGNNQSINGHEFVDLGLPSGKYWATVNYGAKNPEDAGTYLSFNSLSSVKNGWGEYWKLPSKEEMQELIDECKWTWSELNGMAGFEIRGPNGNIMFLPAAGGHSILDHSVGVTAYYYTSDNESYFDYWILEGNKAEINIASKSVAGDDYPVRPISTVKDESVFSVDGLNFTVVSANEKTANLAKGNYGNVLVVPSTVKYPSAEWEIVGIDKDALSECNDLSAIIWKPDAAFTEKVDNPNLLLYVNQAKYAPSSIKNVVVDGSATSITLTDAADGNDFYCPQAFTAQTIYYTHDYKMTTGIGKAQGWETIAVPFDVQKVTHNSKGELTPFVNWKSSDSKKPFWLLTYGDNGWTEANSIKANTPYIISMPNHSNYKEEFRLNGNVTFSAENVTVPTSDNLHSVRYNGQTFTPTYRNQRDDNYYALNVNNDYVTYSGSDVEGSKFLIGLRAVRPFEAYMTSASQARSYIAIDEDMATGIGDITEILADERTVRVYNLNGQLILAEENKRIDEIKSLLSAGVYIVNGKKIIIR